MQACGHYPVHDILANIMTIIVTFQIADHESVPLDRFLKRKHADVYKVSTFELEIEQQVKACLNMSERVMNICSNIDYITYTGI